MTETKIRDANAWARASQFETVTTLRSRHLVYMRTLSFNYTFFILTCNSDTRVSQNRLNVIARSAMADLVTGLRQHDARSSSSATRIARVRGQLI